MHAFGQSTALAVAPHGIPVTSVAPGFVATGGHEGKLAGPEGRALHEQSPLRHLADVPALHGHHDHAALPRSVTHLASTPGCGNRAFAVGIAPLGLQFHLGTPARDVERWLVGRAEALTTAGIEPRAVRHATADGRARAAVLVSDGRWHARARPRRR